MYGDWVHNKVPLFVRVTLYAEFLPMKSRATCILLIEVWSAQILYHFSN